MGLVNWWTLNNTLEDCIGDNHLLTSGAFTSNDAGKIGRCFYASTTTAYAYSRRTIMIDGNISLCCWVKLTAITKDPTGILTLHDHGSTSNIGLNTAGGKLGVSIGYTDGSREWSDRKGTTTLSANVWYHVAVTFDKTANRISLYLNGVREYTGTLSKTVKFSAFSLTVNRWSVNYTDYMSTGYYNDIRLYNHALSAKEVKEIAKGLILHYDFNTIPKNNIVCDSSGFKNHSINMVAPTWNIESNLGNHCISGIDGSAKYIQLPNTAKITDAASVSFWIRIDTSGTNWTSLFGGIRDGANDGKYGISIHINTENKIFSKMYGTSAKIDLTSSTALNATGWNHVVITNKNNSHSIYINGVKTATGTTDIGALNWTNVPNLYLGRATDNYANRSLSIDDFRLYSTMLSDTDVLELYQTKASVSKNGKLFANEICETNFVTKEAYNAKWARIFYHNNKSGTVLFGSNKNEFLSCHTTDKISDLWALERFRDKDGKFELLLEYGDETGYNRWKQTSDFTKTTAITGYEAVSCSWTGNAWGGLALSQDSGSTWVDGSPNSGGSSWWYAIGCKGAFEGGIPGGTKAVTGTVSLWVRTDNVSSVKVTKKGIVYATEINEVDNTSMKTKTELNANWVRLFYHNIKTGTVLFSNDKNEFLKCNTGDKISDLWALEQFRGKDGKFELLLQYQSGGTSYNRWKQSSNFTKETIAGYEAVACSWTQNYWGGLEPDTSGNTWVDGSVNHNNWYYSIGSKKDYASGGMPSWTECEAGWVEIWVRCDDIDLFRMIKGGKCKATEFIEN